MRALAEDVKRRGRAQLAAGHRPTGYAGASPGTQAQAELSGIWNYKPLMALSTRLRALLSAQPVSRHGLLSDDLRPDCAACIGNT
jgi:hypothetical protein